jgi:hypothetical protein
MSGFDIASRFDYWVFLIDCPALFLERGIPLSCG